MDRISRIFSGGRVPHSFLITGEEGAEKEAFAENLARALLCDGDTPPCGVCSACRKTDHPDLIRALSPALLASAKDKIKLVRETIASAHVLPNDAKRKVYLISDAARLTVQQQNVLLATIEEPPRHACFILTATHASDLIPTVVSRCSEIKLSGHGCDLLFLEEAKSVMEPLSRRDELGVFSACTALEKSFKREDLPAFLESCRTMLRDGALSHLPPLAEAQELRFTHAEFLACSDALEHAFEGVRRNLGVAIILGALCVRLSRAMSAEEEQ